ncbi:unnamed protein product [Linum tenue]|uniref:Uncharacterized protein n=1 Tax=Linum tenue TaxID=586396 RepID=A0AAV0LWM8_9ROSI|nr:unnamed protein product [Linum tenue]
MNIFCQHQNFPFPQNAIFLPCATVLNSQLWYRLVAGPTQNKQVSEGSASASEILAGALTKAEIQVHSFLYATKVGSFWLLGGEICQLYRKEIGCL